MESIKVVGVSGGGKSTLISELKKICGFKSVNYGDFLAEASGFFRNRLHACEPQHHCIAQARLKEFLKQYEKENCLILFDEHLEINIHQDLSNVYREENTIGIIFLDIKTEEILSRQKNDKERHRNPKNLLAIEEERKIIKYKVEKLAKQLHISVLTIKTLDLEKSVNCAVYFIQKLMGR